MSSRRDEHAVPQFYLAERAVLPAGDEPQAHGGWTLQDLGTAARTVTGEGVFFGETAYESLRTLEALLAQGGAGALTLPHVGTLQAVLTELEGEQEPRENFVRYRFTFVEAA